MLVEIASLLIRLTYASLSISKEGFLAKYNETFTTGVKPSLFTVCSKVLTINGFPVGGTWLLSVAPFE